MSAYGASFSLLEDLRKLLSQSHRIVIPDLVIRELSRISRGGGKAAAAAGLAIQISRDLEVVSVGGEDADEAILKLADRYGKNTVVCTNDAELKNILKDRGRRVVGVRDYSHLDFL